METPSLQSLEDEKIQWRRRALLALTLFIVAVMAVTVAAPVKKVALATGSIEAAEDIVVIEHLEGGDVRRVFVQPNDEVAAGAPLLKLDERAVNAEISSLEIRRAHLSLRAARLESLLLGAPFAAAASPHLSALDRLNAERLFEAETANFDSERAALLARIAERKADQRALRAARVSLVAELGAYREQVDLSETLNDQGLGTRSTVLEGYARAAAAQTRLAEMDGRIIAADEAVTQLQAELRRVEAQQRADWSAALTEAAEEGARTDAALDDAYRRREGLMVVAPIAGRILELGSSAAGDVITPGELIARIVPSPKEGALDLVAEVRISPDDIGHIGENAQAIVEVSTFKSDVFGEIAGSVISISPSSIADEQGAPTFRARLSLDRTVAELGDGTLRLAPGMLVTARIVTVERSLLDYLIEPITRALKVAFTD